MRRLALVALLCAHAQAQTPALTPRIGYVYPAGGQRGTSFEITAGGQFLNGVKGARFSGEGIEAQVVEHKRPLTANEINSLREEYKALMERKAPGKPPLTAAEEKKLAEVQKQLANVIRRPLNPAIAETVRVQVTIAPNAAAGDRELRLQMPAGLTNPLRFVIGTIAETSETHAQASLGAAEVALPVILNGQILPASADRYRFALEKGQNVFIAAQARELVPYISDAVPGWFQAALTLFDPQGREVVSTSSNGFKPDPVLAFEAPAAGTYQLEIRDSIYRGREDFVYRLSLGAPVAALPTAQTKGGSEREPNNEPKKAQELKLGGHVRGSMGAAGDVDVYKVKLRSGEEMVAEVTARRAGSRMDSLLRLVDAAGVELARNDDHDDPATGLLTHHADSRMQWKAAKAGVYYLFVSDTQRQGGPDVTYGLELRRPTPDYELRVSPSSVNIAGGSHAPVTVHAIRKDGYQGEIVLSLKGAPDGFTLSGGRIPPGVNKVRITLSAPPSMAGNVVALRLEGKGSGGGRELRREAVPAEDMMQAFAYRHLVPAREWIAAVTGDSRRRATWPAVSTAIRLAPGGKTELRFPAQLGRFGQDIRLSLSDPPEGIAIENVYASPNGVSVVLKGDSKVQAGLQGNLIFDAFIERTGDNKQVRRVPIGTLPAVPFQVVRQ